MSSDRDKRLLSALDRLAIEVESLKVDVAAGRPVVQPDVLGNLSGTAVRELGAYVERQHPEGS